MPERAPFTVRQPSTLERRPTSPAPSLGSGGRWGQTVHCGLWVTVDCGCGGCAGWRVAGGGGGVAGSRFSDPTRSK
eukprot:scaffold89663_cov73-Phaeocystis_antarctica.AAC.2